VQYGRVDVRRWARTAAVLVVAAVVLLAAHQQLAAAWSNHCDPGNAQFNLLKSDAVVGFHPLGELFTWENDGPDNSWTCANPTLSVSHVGQDLAGMLRQTKSNMTDSGWTAIDLGQTHADFFLYQRNATGGVRLTAVVLENAFWVEVDLGAPGLHPGQNGF